VSVSGFTCVTCQTGTLFCAIHVFDSVDCSPKLTKILVTGVPIQTFLLFFGPGPAGIWLMLHLKGKYNFFHFFMCSLLLHS
jgi:hypothetical protein